MSRFCRRAMHGGMIDIEEQQHLLSPEVCCGRGSLRCERSSDAAQVMSDATNEHKTSGDDKDTSCWNRGSL